jgi:hypothetical protein
MKLAMMMIGILLLSSCSSTEKLVYVQPSAFSFQKTIEPAPRTIRVHPEDSELYGAYIDSLRDKLKFHNNQIDEYFKSFGEGL